jgi:hypothetical protein
VNATATERSYSAPSSVITSPESIGSADNDSTDDVTYEYDALGRRVQRDDGTDETIFVQNGQQTFLDYESGAAANSPDYCYIYASYVDEPVMRIGHTGGGEHYYHRNQQYSIITSWV